MFSFLTQFSQSRQRSGQLYPFRWNYLSQLLSLSVLPSPVNQEQDNYVCAVLLCGVNELIHEVLRRPPMSIWVTIHEEGSCLEEQKNRFNLAAQYQEKN